jgi:tetratricopeptide (TPR) repeat protein
MGGARSRVSLCLIARDEAELLPGCLASVRGAVDELVVVDTGSVDGTREVARAAGALVLDLPWDDDFSAPRNLAARAASGDWLLVLDADERLAPGAGERLGRQLAGADFDVGLLRLHNASRRDASPAEVVAGAARFGAPALLPRLVRNVDRPEWRGVIHESVGEWLLRRGGRRGLVDLDVMHLGALPSVRRSRDKGERNVALLKRRLALEPGDVTPAGYLALELLDLGRLGEAEVEVERAWALLAGQPPWRCLHRLAMARGLLALRASDAVRALATASLAEARNGPHPDWDYLRAAGLDLQAQEAPPGSPGRARLLEAAEAALRLARERSRGGGPFDLVGLALETRLQLHLGSVLLQRGCFEAAGQALAEALRLEPGNWLAGVGLAEALLGAGEPARALAAVEPLLGAGPDGWLVAAAAAASLGATGDARLFLAQAARRAGAGLGSAHRAGLRQALEGALGTGDGPGAPAGAAGGRPRG